MQKLFGKCIPSPGPSYLPKSYSECGLSSSRKAAVSRWFGTIHCKTATDTLQSETILHACRYGMLDLPNVRLAAAGPSRPAQRDRRLLIWARAPSASDGPPCADAA